MSNHDVVTDPRELDAKLDTIGRWVMDTCRMFGVPLETAYLIAGHFVAGLRRDGLRADVRIPGWPS